jgi:uncharacterized delta-60 repeat protein
MLFGLRETTRRTCSTPSRRPAFRRTQLALEALEHRNLLTPAITSLYPNFMAGTGGPFDTAGNYVSTAGTAITMTPAYTVHPYPQGLSVAYAWRVTGGQYTVDPATGTNSPSFTFTPAAGETYVVSVTETDSLGVTTLSTAIDVTPSPPAVNISQGPSARLQGTLDLTFGNGVTTATSDTGGTITTTGNGGTVTTDLGSDDDEAGAVFALPNGKVLVLGYTDQGGVNDSNLQLLLLRYNADGTLDSTYQNGPKPGAPPVGNPSSQVAVGPEGQVVILQGNTVWQFNPNGSLDTNFGVGGSLTTEVPAANTLVGQGPNGSIAGIAFDGDRIIVAGLTTDPTTGVLDQFIVERYNANGTPDTSFGGTGEVITDLGLYTDGLPDGVSTVTVQPDGAILVGGAVDGSKLTPGLPHEWWTPS